MADWSWLGKTVANVAPVVVSGLLQQQGSEAVAQQYSAAASAATTAAEQARVADIEERRRQYDISREDLLSFYLQEREDVAPYRQAGLSAVGGLAGMGPSGAQMQAPTTPNFAQMGGWTAQAPDLAQMGGWQVATPDMQGIGGMDTLEMDPGYQFRMAEGQKALERQQIAGGMQDSGRAMKEMARYSQGLASEEYGRAYEREYASALQDYQLRYNQAQSRAQQAAQGYDVRFNQAQSQSQQALQGYQAQYGAAQDRYTQAYGRERDYVGDLARLAGYGGTTQGMGMTTGANLANLGQQTASGISGAQQNYGNIAATNLMAAGAGSAQATGNMYQGWGNALGEMWK